MEQHVNMEREYARISNEEALNKYSGSSALAHRFFKYFILKIKLKIEIVCTQLK